MMKEKKLYTVSTSPESAGAFAMGYEAYWVEESNANPFPVGSENYREYEDGYADAWAFHTSELDAMLEEEEYDD